MKLPNSVKPTLSVAALALAVAMPHAFAQNPPTERVTVSQERDGSGAGTTRVAELQGRITSVDRTNQRVGIRGGSGEEYVFAADPSLVGLDQVRVGDLVSATYVEATGIELRKRGGGVRERHETNVGNAQVPAARTPAIRGANRVEVVADVTGYDPQSGLITLRGPDRTVTVRLQDPSLLRDVQVGDQVELTYVEARLTAVQPGGADMSGAAGRAGPTR